MSRASAIPHFHDTVTIPVVGRSEGLRVVVTEDGILGSVVRWFELPLNRDKSRSWQNKACRAVGLLYDYLVAVPDPTDLAGRRSVLTNFVQHLIAGTIGADGTDATGLFWRPAASWAGVKETLSYVTMFADHCSAKDGIDQLNPEIGAGFSARVARLRALDIQNSHSLLKHLNRPDAAFDAAQRARAVHARREPKISSVRPPYFPLDKIDVLFAEGFSQEKAGIEPWKKHHLRDMMIVMLQRFGGLRSSEPFHLFTSDVREDPSRPGQALVLLYHPELGQVRYADPLSRRVVTSTRLEYLRKMYGRDPRNRLSGKESAGWKTLMLDEGNPHYFAKVRWFPQEAGAIFWQLYTLYIRHALPNGLAHPYLFINFGHGIAAGQPYQISSYYKNLRKAVERIGLEYRKSLGTTSHGFRHAYGQTLENSKVDPKIIQICMHHTSLHSQEVYTRPELQKVSDELEAARLRLAGEHAGTDVRSHFQQNDLRHLLQGRSTQFFR